MKKILIIDDDKFVTRIYEMKFQQAGFAVTLAADGAAGLAAARHMAPDVILLDLVLPGMRGVDVLAELRKEDRLKQVPVIVFSNTQITSSDILLQNGATKVLWKSSHPPKQVVAAVLEVLEKPGSTAPAAKAAAAIADPDEEMHRELRQACLNGRMETLAKMKSALSGLEKNPRDIGAAFEFMRAAHNLAGNAGLAGLRNLARLATAIEALLSKLYDAPEHSSASTTRTLSHALGVLERLYQPQKSVDLDELPPRILVLDDQEIARRAASIALQSAQLVATCLAEPETALLVMKDNPFDVAFLDINMPQMSGVQFRDRMRKLDLHRKTPVVFYTTDAAATRTLAQEESSDFILKPFLSSELALKALAYSFQARLAV
ncbi:MAG TPA: response regulator [Planctomycetota bacterium]|nr:response regulator [Planctomycetota bacterium]